MLTLNDTTLLDSFPIIRGSVVISLNGQVIQQGFTIDYSNRWILPDSLLKGKSVSISYRIIPVVNRSNYYHKSDALIEPVFSSTPRYYYNYSSNQTTSRSLFDDGLNANGNLARGLGFGNNQDLVINSSLNLQINGKLGKGISMLAAISDENNPIQPQGNTQQIQDFDKVFISIIKDSSALTVGDFLMTTTPDNYFMRYYKKSRGVQFDLVDGSKIKHHFHADGAISRGKFVRNEIQGTEGNQGPYRLQGANGELNIIVISATESVYLDGEKLERGQQNDYVIDYNTGEITFMPKRLINQYNRIVVEFQYSDRNYNRSVFTISEKISNGAWSGKVHYFTEQDNKQQPTDTTASSSIRNILETRGDDPAIFNNEVKYNKFQSGRVNYRKIDSSGNTIYLYSNEPESDSVFYTLSFSLVGNGKGNYIQIASSANGRVFAWVAPVNGVPQGNYEPYIALVSPKKLQMLTLGIGYQPSKDLDVKLEGAYTNYDKNTYSSIQKNNDDGLGLFFSANRKKLKLNDRLKLNSGLKIEYISKNFQYVERYRAVEFNRVWNRQLSNSNNLPNSSSELVSTFNAGLDIGKFQSLRVELGNYNRSSLFNGLRGTANYSFVNSFAAINFGTEQMSSSFKTSAISNDNKVAAYRLEAQFNTGNLIYGVNAALEESVFSNDTTKSFSLGSFRYNQVALFLKSKSAKNWTYKLDASIRNDDQINGKSFSYASTGVNLSGNLEHSGKKQNRLSMTGSYRKLNYVAVSDDEEVILGRIEYNANFFKRVVTTSTYYQIGTGREQKRTFSFALVQSGNGTHTWVDYNKNGIEEINEFEPAVYADQAKYVKVYLPGNEFIKSNSNEFNQSLRLQAPADWQGATPFKRFVFRFNSISSYKADRKITDNSLATIINPFKLNVADSSLISINSLIKQTTFFNRSNSKFGIEHNIQSNRGKQFLYNGFEWKQTDKNQMSVRFGFAKRFNVVTELESQLKQNRNQYFENRNYKYKAEHIFPELFYQTRKGLRLGTFMKYTEALNAPEFGNESAYITEYGLEFRYFIINKGNIDAKFSTHDIKFTGNSNSPLAFDLLNGLSNGRNMTWNINFGGKTKGNIQINLTYEGRKTQVYKTVHIGRAEARYIF